MRKLRVGRSQGEKALWLIQDACTDSHNTAFFFFPSSNYATIFDTNSSLMQVIFLGTNSRSCLNFLIIHNQNNKKKNYLLKTAICMPSFFFFSALKTSRACYMEIESMVIDAVFHPSSHQANQRRFRRREY